MASLNHITLAIATVYNKVTAVRYRQTRSVVTKAGKAVFTKLKIFHANRRTRETVRVIERTSVDARYGSIELILRHARAPSRASPRFHFIRAQEDAHHFFPPGNRVGEFFFAGFGLDAVPLFPLEPFRSALTKDHTPVPRSSSLAPTAYATESAAVLMVQKIGIVREVSAERRSTEASARRRVANDSMTWLSG